MARLRDELEVNVAQRTAELHVADDEVAALRRIATLVAQGVPSGEIFSAVSEEVGRLFGSEISAIVRFERDCAAAVMGVCGGPHAPGARVELEPGYAVAAVRRTARAARFDTDDPEAAGMPELVRTLGIRSGVASPIVVDGELWGAITLASLGRSLPRGTEGQLAEFTELVATALANAQARDALSLLAAEQAALRQVAVLVAEQPSPDEVFTAVTEAVGRLLGADLAAMQVFPGDGTSMTIAGWSATGPILPIGTRLPLDGGGVTARIFHTRAPARMDGYDDIESEGAGIARGLRLRSTVGAPILVEGRLWGALVAATRDAEPFAEDAQNRIGAFTEIVATAVSNAQAREDVRRLADEQAALRRVATLVAHGARPPEVFAAVSQEVGRLFGSDTAAVLWFDTDDAAVVFVGTSKDLKPTIPVGTRLAIDEPLATAQVYRTGRSARFDEWDRASLSPALAETVRRSGVVSTVASPIIVEGRRWGAVTAASKGWPLPLDAGERLERFSELVATAIANADSRAELAASRKRIVAASDEARRQIERDLHDGTQQRLVSLGLAVRAAEANVPPDADDLRAELQAIATGLGAAVKELQELSRGIHPAILSKGGLRPALRTLARRSAVPVELDFALDSRLPPTIEVATYYFVSEALANAAKHAQASWIEVSLVRRDNVLLLSIRDDGVGGADPVGGSGLVGMTDRLEALGGSVSIESPPGEGTHITAELPL